MSTAAQRAAELRALADQHEAIGGLEETHEAALDAYRADPSEENKTAYAAASMALRDARQEARGSGVMVASSEPGSVTIGAATVRKGS